MNKISQLILAVILILLTVTLTPVVLDLSSGPTHETYTINMETFDTYSISNRSAFTQENLDVMTIYINDYLVVENGVLVGFGEYVHFSGQNAYEFNTHEDGNIIFYYGDHLTYTQGDIRYIRLIDGYDESITLTLILPTSPTALTGLLNLLPILFVVISFSAIVLYIKFKR